MDDMKDRIISLMKAKEMSQKTFAAEICISEGALSSIFTGRTRPTLNTVYSIHDRFPEVNMSWLMDGKGEMFVVSDAAASVPALSPAIAQEVPAVVAPAAVANSSNAAFTGVPQMQFAAPTEKNVDKPARKISEIRVFYDDGTFETFPGNAK